MSALPPPMSRMSGWEPSPRQRMTRLALVAVAHIVVGFLLWRGVVAVMPSSIVVPVSIALFSPPAEIIKPPQPVPPRKPDPRLRETPVQMPTPEVPVESTLVLPAVEPQPQTAPPPPPEAKVADVPPSPPRIQLPSSTADYLTNPVPPYPPISKRLREQGRVLLWVLVSPAGTPQKIELRASSGFSRLDEVALETVARWKFVPGKRNGVAEAMWVEVPLDFKLS